MRRRVVLIGGIVAAASRAARAEPTIKVGIIGPAEQPRFAALVEGLRQGLQAQGYAVARIALLQEPVARGDAIAVAAAARRLRAETVVAIFAISSEVARAVQPPAGDTPIVFITPGDPMAAGLVTSLARPGGNLTGVTFEFPELSAKRLELASEAVGPGRVLVVVDPLDPSPQQALAAVRQAALPLGMTLVEAPIRAESDVATALAALPGAVALLAIPGGAPTAHHARLIGAAQAARVMSVFPARTHSTEAAVITYGARDEDIARDAARLIGRIASGARVGDLPVERPTRVALVLNLRSARAIGLTLPPAIRVRADEVLE